MFVKISEQHKQYVASCNLKMTERIKFYEGVENSPTCY